MPNRIAAKAQAQASKNACPKGIETLRFSGSFETGGGIIIALGTRDDAVLPDAVHRFTEGLESLRRNGRRDETCPDHEPDSDLCAADPRG
jgi:hypothetical protein